MDKLINKTVDTTFKGVDGNAFNLMSHFRKNARRQVECKYCCTNNF